jgi:hypothetical protein
MDDAVGLTDTGIADEEMAEYRGIDFWPDSGSLLVLFSLRGNPPYGHVLGQHAADRSILPRRQIFPVLSSKRHYISI